MIRLATLPNPGGLTTDEERGKGFVGVFVIREGVPGCLKV